MRAIGGLIVLTLLAPVARAQTPPDARTERVEAEQRFRYRLLGIYDGFTGDPVTGVEVADVLAGSKTETGATGVVSLFFLPEGASIIRLRKVGFELVTMPVMIAPHDT